MTVRSELNGTRISVHDTNLSHDWKELAVLRSLVDLPCIRTDINDVALVNVDNPIRRAAYRHGIGCHEVLAVAQPHHHGRPLAGGNDATRLIGGNHGDGIAAAQTLDSRHDSLEQVTFIVVVDQMRDYFRIRLTRELIALGLKFSSDLLMILNDAVMDQRNVIARNMRMCVADLWRAMRGQRVCAMPTLPFTSSSATLSLSSCTRDTVRALLRTPLSSVATPQES